MAQTYENRKPVMDEDKRKVLNLLEFISEMCPSLRVCQLIVNCVPPEVRSRMNNDLYYIPDADMKVYLQEYADNLVLSRKLAATRQYEESENVVD
jgi:hypothetical protein